MTSIKRIFKESRIIHLILCIIGTTTLTSKLAESTILNKETIGATIFMGIFLALFISYSVIGLNLVTNYRLSILFGRNRNDSVKDLYKYILFLSLLGSLAINVIGLFMHYLPENPLVPMILGFNFNILKSILIRIPLIAILLAAFAIIGLFYATVFSVQGVVVGISAIILGMTCILASASTLIEAFQWGQSLYIILAVLLAITGALYKATYILLQGLEVK
jgi:hypothetical protein